jgi:anti-anti-sigma factor
LSPAPFKVNSEEREGVFVVAVEGELDMSTAADLERELEGPAKVAGAPLLIDLSRCEFIDSTGIALIVRSWQELGPDGRFAICGVGAQVKRVLDITGLEETIPTHPSREEALARLHS